MPVRGSPRRAYPIIDCLNALRCYGYGYVGGAMQFLLGEGMDARRADACVPELAIGRYVESLCVRSDCHCRDHGQRTAMGISMPC